LTHNDLVMYYCIVVVCPIFYYRLCVCMYASSFTCSKVTETVPKLKSRSCDPRAPLRVIHHPLDSSCRVLSNKEKTKCLASTIQKLWRGSQNLKSRSHGLDPFDPKMLFFVEFHLGHLPTKFSAARLIV